MKPVKAFVSDLALLFFCFATLVRAQTATVDWSSVHQRIDGFGASSAYFGTPWTESQADLVFSPDKGIGLSLLRVKITADVTGTATASKMLTSSTEIGIAKQAIARGARAWGTPWSPPAQFKTSTNTIAGNFVSANNQAYANMLASYVADMKAAGVAMYAISIQNEPDFVPSSYEGCGWSAQQFHDFIPFLYSALAAKGVGSTRIMMPESDVWQSQSGLSAITTSLNDPAVAPMIGIIANHDYAANNQTGSTVTPTNLPHAGKALWETEVSTTSAFDGGIANGIYWGQRVHLFMTAAQAGAWNWWWFQNYTPGGGAGDNSGLFGQNFAPTKRAYVLGQFARFVRPGFYRIDASTTGTALISAYKDPATGNFAIVAINNTASDVTETFNMTHFQTSLVTPWITSATQDLAKLPDLAVAAGSFVTTLPANSVTTFVGSDTTPKPALSSSRLLNLSIRSNAGTNDQTLIASFVVSGGAKQLLVRAAGPALTGFGVPGALAHPQLELINQNTSVSLATNTGWDTGIASDTDLVRSTTAALTFPFAAGSADSAMVKTLPNGAYSAKVSGLNNTTGVALAELYDSNLGTGGRLINASARTNVGTNDNVLIAGFVISGTESKTVLIRAVGPTLANFGVGGTLGDPALELTQHVSSNNTDVTVATNTAWGSTTPADIVGASKAVGAFDLVADSLDSALLVTLQPGQYSAIVRGASGDTGVALAEIYEVR
jgi:glucuronoarabinoxylan endo-1,4-beta-xylanase